MKEKQRANRFRNVMWDYYLTNQKIAKEYEEANKGNKGGKLNRQEKIYVAIIVVGSVLLVLKYLVF